METLSIETTFPMLTGHFFVTPINEFKRKYPEFNIITVDEKEEKKYYVVNLEKGKYDVEIDYDGITFYGFGKLKLSEKQNVFFGDISELFTDKKKIEDFVNFRKKGIIKKYFNTDNFVKSFLRNTGNLSIRTTFIKN